MGTDDPISGGVRVSQRPVSRAKMLAGAAAIAGGALAFPGSRKAFAAATPGVPFQLPSDNSCGDTVAQIVTAALIAEDLATTFYYNGLIAPAVIQDPNLAGPGGSATNVTSAGNLGNVEYLQAALTEEIAHANLLRSLLGASSATTDPFQTFYLPASTFSNLTSFLAILDALENAFIGAYLAAVREFAALAADAKAGSAFPPGRATTSDSTTLEYYAEVAASILGVECEHRVLGRVIGNQNPANDRVYELTDGITCVYNGSTSAVTALTPFLTASTGPAYSLQTALTGAATVGIAVPFTNPPSM